MAGIYFMVRGIKRQFDEWVSSMNAQRFPWKRTNLNVCKCGKTKKECKCEKFEPREELNIVQGALRPVQLFEYVVPKECVNDVLINNGIKGPIQRKEIKGMAWLLKKMMKLKPIPDLTNETVTGYHPNMKLNGNIAPAQPVHSVFTEGLAIYPLGIREDAMGVWDKDGDNYEQEML